MSKRRKTFEFASLESSPQCNWGDINTFNPRMHGYGTNPYQFAAYGLCLSGQLRKSIEIVIAAGNDRHHLAGAGSSGK